MITLKENLYLLLLTTITISCAPLAPEIQATSTNPSSNDQSADITTITPVPTSPNAANQSSTDSVPYNLPEDAELHTEGPWLLYGVRNDSNIISGLYISNFDSTGIIFLFGEDTLSKNLLETETDDSSPEDALEESEETDAISNQQGTSLNTTILTYSLSPNHANLAILTKDTTTSMTLWIISLPFGEIIQSLQLIGPEAQQVLNSSLFHFPSNSFFEDSNKILFPNTFPISFLWSPDSQNIALSAAIDGPSTDIYNYGVNTETLSRLTSGPGESVLMGWSPDSHWIINQGLSSQVSTFKIADGVYAVSKNGEQILFLYAPEPSATEVIVSWSSNSEFINYSSRFGLPSTQLRNVDINSQTTFSLIDAIFQKAQSDPNGSTVFIELYGFPNWSPEIIPGNYRFLPSNGNLDKFLPPGYSQIAWVPELELFAAAPRITSAQIIYFNNDGEVIFTIPRSHPIIKWPVPSPDGQLLLTPIQSAYALYTSDGEILTSIPISGDVLWHPDSSNAIIINKDGFLYQILKNNDWEPEIINPEFIINSNILLISP